MVPQARSSGHRRSIDRALALGPGQFRLPQERVQGWYGLSATTFQKGVQTLVRADLLHRTHIEEEAPLLPQGFTRINLYKLQGPFARKRRTKGS